MNNTAVVFIHGFTGGEETWINENKTSIFTLLESFPELSVVGFHAFPYHTKIVNISNNIAAKVVTGIINKILPKKLKIKTPITKRNSPISEIAQELITYIKYELHDYENIIFICHSMGGLIAKNAIINIIENDVPFEHDIIGYCSLATPHKGSIPSILISPFNINAKEMKPLDGSINALNDKWITHSDKIDKTLYVRAKSDEFVSLASSVPFNDTRKFPFEVVEADHTSICKPDFKTDRICKILKKFILDCLSKAKIKNSSLDDFTDESSSYDKEIFVIKLVLAEVNNLLIDDAKESFFLAEIVEKQSTKHERKTIKILTDRIISTYRTLAGSDNIESSSELVGRIHEKIIDSDKQALDCIIKHINFMHKKGFLHKHANQKNLNINWKKAVTMDEILNYKDAIND